MAQVVDAPHPPIREEWLALRREEILLPELPIVDPHHHLWDRAGSRYLLPELLADLQSGHNVQATVYVQARSMYRAGGPAELRPLGEVEFANGVAAQSASGIYGPVHGAVQQDRGKNLSADPRPGIKPGTGRIAGWRSWSARRWKPRRCGR